MTTQVANILTENFRCLSSVFRDNNSDEVPTAFYHTQFIVVRVA